jgi:hypothetical protein
MNKMDESKLKLYRKQCTQYLEDVNKFNSGRKNTRINSRVKDQSKVQEVSSPNFKLKDTIEEKISRKILRGKLMKILNNSLIKEESEINLTVSLKFKC